RLCQERERSPNGSNPFVPVRGGHRQPRRGGDAGVIYRRPTSWQAAAARTCRRSSSSPSSRVVAPRAVIASNPCRAPAHMASSTASPRSSPHLLGGVNIRGATFFVIVQGREQGVALEGRNQDRVVACAQVPGRRCFPRVIDITRGCL